MRYRYLDYFRRGISVFAIFSYGITVLGTPQCPPHNAADHSNSVKILPCLRKTYPIKRLPSSHLVSGYSLVSYNGNTHVAIKLWDDGYPVVGK